jgi:hypothetical protein
MASCATLATMVTGCGGDGSPTGPSGGGSATDLTLLQGPFANARVRVTTTGTPLANVGGAARVESNAGLFLVSRTSDTTFTVIDGTCTHEGCTSPAPRPRSSSARAMDRDTASPDRCNKVPRRQASGSTPALRGRRAVDRGLTEEGIHPMARLNPEIDHLLRRAGFGISAADVNTYQDMSFAQAVAHLVDYEGRPDDVDARIGREDHARVNASNDRSGGLFSPDIDIDDARQRWMFRMIHTRRPLQEKMTLFWHNHFATGFSKLANDSGMLQGAKLLAHKPGVLRGPQGQIELFRQYALGNFRNLLLEVAKDPAMVIWLDGNTNTRAKPQENFGREIMELFTLGVDFYTEPDVYAAARVFTGWNLQPSVDYTNDDYGSMNAYQEFRWRPDQHETSAKTFSFPSIPTAVGRFRRVANPTATRTAST